MAPVSTTTMCNERESDNHTAIADVLHVLPVQKGEPKIVFTDEESERFWSKADKSPHPKGCWLWTRCRDKDGYGNFQYQGRRNYSHRIAYRVTHGPIPPGMVVSHSCDEPNCINPDHLSATTHMDNMKDKVKKGRHNMPRGTNHYMAKLTDDQVREIRVDCASGTMSQSAIARKYGVCQMMISRIKRGLRYTEQPLQEVPDAKEYYQPLKITDQQVLEIIELCKSGTMLQREIGAKYGVRQDHISRIFRGHRRKKLFK